MPPKKKTKTKDVHMNIRMSRDLRELIKEAAKANPSGMSFAAYVRGCLAAAARRDLRQK